MDGITAQIVALTCHGNAYLSGQETDSFFPNNSTCGFCEQVNFVLLHKSLFGKIKQQEYAKTPDEWFVKLKTLHAKGIRLSIKPENNPHIPDRISSAAVGGGGVWTMEVIYPQYHSEFWISRWEGHDLNAPDKRIWRVTYGRIAFGKTLEDEPHDLAEINAKFTKALREIHSFADKHNNSFKKYFADALETLDSQGAILHGHGKGLAPTGFLSSEALTILDACQTAWVFGGMGSWNDLSFEGDDQKEYERVSDQLFQILNEAIAAAANSTYKLA